MKERLLYFAWLGMLALAPAVRAAGPAQEAPLELTLGEAVEVALSDNPLVLGAREKRFEFGQLVRQARSQALPRLDSTVSFARNRDPGLRNSPFFSRLLEGPDPIPPQALEPFFFTNYLWQLDVEQPIYSFGRVQNALRAARHEVDGVGLDIRAVENQVARDVALACYDLLLAAERLDVLATEQKARERQLRQVQDRFELEDATRLDLLRAQVALANLRPEVLSAENAVRVARARLNETLGRPVDAPIEVEEILDPPENVPELPEPEVLIEMAERNRPELLRFAVNRRVLQDRVGITRADVLPEIDANATFGINTFGFDNLGDLSFRSWAVGVSFRWTIFDGFQTPSAMAQLLSQQDQSLHEESAFRLELAREIERVHGDFQRAREAAEVAEIAVEQAREAERVAEESFRWGAATVLDILEAERALREAELNRAQAVHDVLVALAELKHLTGHRADAPASVLENPPVARAEGDVP